MPAPFMPASVIVEDIYEPVVTGMPKGLKPTPEPPYVMSSAEIGGIVGTTLLLLFLLTVALAYIKKSKEYMEQVDNGIGAADTDAPNLGAVFEGLFSKSSTEGGKNTTRSAQDTIVSPVPQSEYSNQTPRNLKRQHTDRYEVTAV